MTKRTDRTNLLICLALVIVTLAVYWQVFGFGFVTLDDQDYVVRNHHVLAGVSVASLRWAFTTRAEANWHPLTWTSLMLDAQLGHGSPATFHVTNVILHLGNTLLLFALMLVLTGYRWRSAAVAALFALHPLHVESVAWVTERKDVLSTLFWLLTMLAYVRYARRPKIGSYLLIVAPFVLGLMAKPMLVSLPIVLLLLDIWPLKRETKWRVLVVEKLPLFALAAASCTLTYWAQSTGGAFFAGELYPAGVRAANALVACMAYIIKMVCPMNLSVIYPHPGANLPIWQVALSALFFVLMLFVSIISARKRPYLTIGWLWYVITLLPVIGLVQVGAQAMADRYTYVPLIGLFLIVAMGVPDLLTAANPKQKPSTVLIAAAVAIPLGYGVLAYYQVGYWRSGTDLYKHAIAVDQNNYMAHSGLGNALLEKGDSAGAVKECSLALKLLPNRNERAAAFVHLDLGTALNRTGRYEEAADQLSSAVKYLPASADAQNSLGVSLASLNRLGEAIRHFELAVAGDPGNTIARSNLGRAYLKRGESAAGKAQFAAVLRIDPTDREAKEGLADANNAALSAE